MAFRVLIAGGRHFTNYPALRATLDALFAHRLPDVELLTTSGRGVPMLAASYATARGLKLSTFAPDFRRFPGDAEERRDAYLADEANTALVVWDGRDPGVKQLLELVERLGVPIRVIGQPRQVGRRLGADPERTGFGEGTAGLRPVRVEIGEPPFGIVVNGDEQGNHSVVLATVICQLGGRTWMMPITIPAVDDSPTHVGVNRDRLYSR